MTSWALDMDYDVATCRGAFRLKLAAEWQATATGLFGPSGSGKSTLLELLAGVRGEGRLEGKIEVDGELLVEETRRMAPERRPFGWVPQNAALFPHLTVGENLRFAAKDESWRTLAESLEIASLLERRPHEISGGERQRVALGRALAAGKRILLLDEPLAGLDLPRRRRLMDAIRTITQSTGASFVYVSHEWDEIAELCTTALILEEGRLRDLGDPRTLKPY